MFNKFLIIFTTILLSFGCHHTAEQDNSNSSTTTPIMNSQDLDLATISDMLRNGKVSDADSLQTIINDPNSSLNNVDLDKDGVIDPITVSETQSSNGKQFNLIANPTTGEAITVATINIQQSGNQAYVQAGYPSYVSGYDTDYYSYYTPTTALFILTQTENSQL